jgi:protein dithiol oxidoreductase (disulfide-forming)
MTSKQTPDPAVSVPRRATLGRLAGALAAAWLAPAMSPVAAQEQYVEGSDFDRLPSPLAKEVPGKIEVMEFFAYWCPHCNVFDPSLNEWSKRQPADVVLLHTPWAYQDAQVPLQRMYYVLDALGRESELRARVFSAIHVEHNTLMTPEQQSEWAAKNGIDAKKYRELYESFTVQAKTRRATQMAQSANVSGVPTLMVDGRYLVGSRSSALLVTDFLVTGERKLLPKKS